MKDLKQIIESLAYATYGKKSGKRVENLVRELDEAIERELSVQVDKLVDAFLAWPLPDSVCSDQCATMRGYPHRSGTNLLTAVEAKQMFEYLQERVKQGGGK